MIGGGDAALGDAMYLSRMAKKVYLVHRRQEFRANQALQTAVQQNAAIELVLDAVPTAVLGEKRVNHFGTTAKRSIENAAGGWCLCCNRINSKYRFSWRSVQVG